MITTKKQTTPKDKDCLFASAKTLREDVLKRKMLFAVGDFHGDIDLCVRIFQDIHAYPLAKNDRIILMGNYRTKEILDFLRKYQEINPNLILLRGTIDHRIVRSKKKYFENKDTGTGEFFRSFEKPELHFPTVQKRAGVHVKEFVQTRKFLAKLPYYYETNKFFFSHGGVNPKRMIQEQIKGQLVFMKEEFIQAREFKQSDKMYVYGNYDYKKPLVVNSSKKKSLGITVQGGCSCAVLNDETAEIEDTFGVKASSSYPWVVNEE